MIIIVGLGNPGAKFNHTRHNAGFEALDFFAAEQGFPEFSESLKHQALISEKDNVILVKPQTFMNESGRSVASVMKNKNADLAVVHDEIDVPLGKMKISSGSGSGGHKGIASIIQAVGNQDFTRIKIGVETDPTKKAEEVVLEKFSPEEYTILQSVFPTIGEALEKIISSHTK